MLFFKEYSWIIVEENGTITVGSNDGTPHSLHLLTSKFSNTNKSWLLFKKLYCSTGYKYHTIVKQRHKKHRRKKKGQNNKILISWSNASLYFSTLQVQTPPNPTVSHFSTFTAFDRRRGRRRWERKQWMILLWGKRNINKMKNWKHRRELQKRYEREQD